MIISREDVLKRKEKRVQKKKRVYSEKEINAIKIKQKKQKERSEKAIGKAFVFPNLLDGRNQNIVPNSVWAMDCTLIDTCLKGQPGSKHLLFLIIDHYIRTIIYYKLFFLSKGKGTIKAKHVITGLKTALSTRLVNDVILIHSDNGTEFKNEEYHTFIENSPEFIGSTSQPGQPEHNSVVERVIRTIKHQINNEPARENCFVVPEQTRTTQQVSTFFKNKIQYYNQCYKTKYNKGLTCEEKKAQWYKNEKEKKVVLPDVILTQNQIIVHQLNKINNQLSNLQNLGVATYVQQTQIGEKIDTLVKKPKTKHEKQLLRDPLTQTLLEYILAQPLRKNSRYIVHARFRIMIVILFYTGLRAGELRRFTRSAIYELIETKQTYVFQTKTSANRPVMISSYGQETLMKLKNEIDVVCPNDNDFLFKKSDPKQNKLIEFINERLKPYATQFDLKLTSHSFRTNFITELLRKKSPLYVQQLAAHTSIQSTMTYNRFILSKGDRSDALNESFGPPSEEQKDSLNKKIKKTKGNSSENVEDQIIDTNEN